MKTKHPMAATRQEVLHSVHRTRLGLGVTPTLKCTVFGLIHLIHDYQGFPLFSRQDIEKDEELTFDYMSSKAHWWTVSYDKTAIIDGAGDSSMDDETVLADSADDDMQAEDDADNKSNKSNDSGICSNPSLKAGKTNDNESERKLELDSTSDVCRKTELGTSGDAPSSASTALSKSSPGQMAQPTQYRMVCQCGAKNCRKFVF